MKKSIISLVFVLLASVALALLLCMTSFAAGEVYTVDGLPTVYLSNSETVTVGETTYNTYGTLKEGIAALNKQAGVVVVCGEFTDPTTNSDSTFVDTASRGHILITGLNKDGTDVLKFNHQLSFSGGPTTLENFKLHCLNPSAKYVFGSTDMVWGKGMTTAGSIYYGLLGNLKEVSYAKTTFNEEVNLNQYILSSGSNYAGTQAMTSPATFEIVVNNINKTTRFDLGFNNAANTVYGNVNLIVNGGTFTNKSIILGNKATDFKGAVTAIYNNGITGFDVPAGMDYVVESAEGGEVSIKTQAPYGGAPVFLLTPDDGLAPAVNGTACVANSDGTYTLSPEAPDGTNVQKFAVTWVSATEPTSPMFYSINGEKTAFLKTGGGVYEYEGATVYAFDTLTNIFKANTDKAEIVVLVVGEVSENLHIPNNNPSYLTIRGIDENSKISSTGTVHPWTKVTIENIKVAWTGMFAADGNEFIFGEGLDGTFSGNVYGGGSGSPHGGNLIFNSGVFTKNIYAGSDAATTNTSKCGGHYLTFNGGDFSAATIDAGSLIATDIPNSVVVSVNGGTFAQSQSIGYSNIGTVGGVSAVIFNNGMFDTYGFEYADGFDYAIKSAAGGMVTFDGTDFILTGNAGYAPIVNGKLNITGKFEAGTPGEYVVTWIKTSGTAQAYTIDGVKTAYVKTGGGLIELKEDGTGVYAFSDIVSAIKAAIGGKVIVVGEFSGHTNSFWNGSGTTVICGYDASSSWTFTDTFYNWTPLVIENIILNTNGKTVNADARAFVIGDNVTVEGTGITLIGGAGSKDRNIDVTLNSGTYMTIRGGNSADVGTAVDGTSYYIKLAINGGDYSSASINAGNNSAKTLYGNLLTTITGGTFAEGQTIALNNITVMGNSVLVLSNGIDDTYSFAASANYDYVVKAKSGGTVEVASLGSDTSEPTFVLVPENPLYAPTVNGTPITASATGEFKYVPTAADTQTVIEVDWALDTSPKVYGIGGVLTAFVSSENTYVDGETTYYTFPSLTAAVAALDGNEGEVIFTSDVTETIFTDVAGRKAITIKGLTGSEIYTFSDTFTFLGSALVDDITFNLTADKYMFGYGELTFGEGFSATGGNIYFATDDASKYFPSYTTVNGGKFLTFNVAGAYGSIPAGERVTAEFNGGRLSAAINLGMGEKQATSVIEGNVTLILNADVTNNKEIKYDTNKSPDGTAAIYTVILNNGLADSYTFTEDANAIVDYLVKSGIGGKVAISTHGTSTTSPTLLLTPDDGYIPKVNGDYLGTSAQGYTFTPVFSTSQTVITVEWADQAEVAPAVFDYNGAKATIVKNGGGIVKFDGQSRFAYSDINSAIAALGTDGGYVYIFGTTRFASDDITSASHYFTDVAGREKLYILGIDGTEPVIEYYKNGAMKGDLFIDNLTYHRVDGELYDTGFLPTGFNLELGENFKTTSDFSAQVMTIHGSTSNATYSKKSVITIGGGNITRIVAGSTYSTATITGDTEININGGAVVDIYGGHHGGASNNSTINGNVDINITSGKVSKVRTGSNSKGIINGNVTVRINADLPGIKLYHGSNINTHPINGNSAFVISGGNIDGAIIGDSSVSGVTGENIVIINSDVEGDYTYNHADGHTFIIYDSEGTVDVAYNDDGSFAGFKISCEDESKHILVDGIRLAETDDDIYEIAPGKHTVLFSTYANISFDINGAEGTAPDDEKAYDGVVVTLPDSTGFEMFNHEFVGWSLDADAEIGEMQFTVPEKNVTLYAIWKEIKPELGENSNVENSDAASVIYTSVAADDYETTDFVSTAISFSETDAVVINGAEVAYAYTMRAYDGKGVRVTEFANGINARIPKYVLPKLSVGQVYRIYEVAASGEVDVLEAGDVTVIPYTEDENYLYYTSFSDGDYVVMVTQALEATYTYSGVYDQTNKKYTLKLCFSGASASYGSFGLKYDTSVLTLDSFTFAQDVADAGSTSEADGGFATYYNQNGIYQNTWTAKNGYGINAENAPVEIGTFIFSTGDSFDIDTLTLNCATLSETGVVLEDGTAETVYDNGYYLYAPMIDSVEVYCQPINNVFVVDADDGKFAVNVGYSLVRRFENSFIKDDDTGYDNRAVITVASKAGDVIETAYEDALVISESESGTAVVEFACKLEAGEYTVTFAKNGYVTHISTFEVVDADVSLGTVALVGGDIRDDYSDQTGDGVVDVDDFLRVLRGFIKDAPEILGQSVDINEDGNVTVDDLSVVKAVIITK